MPEFILDHGSPEGAAMFYAFDSFTQGYVEAMFFTDASSADDGDLAGATVADLSQEAIDRIQADCRAFQTGPAGELLFSIYESDTPYSPAQAGRDFWYSRNGHGVGFWDRGLGPIGDKLSSACGWRTQFGELDLYRGDDGRVYFA